MLVDINLLPERERERSTLLIAALIVIGAALLFWATLFLLSLSLSKETAHVETQIASLHARQETIREEIVPSTHADDWERLAATVEWAEAYRFETLPLLRELIALLPERGFFVSFEFTAPHESTVTVQFDNKSDAAYYLARIKSSTVVSTATISSLVAERVDEESGIETLPRFEATYHIEYIDDRGTVVEVEESREMDSEEGDLDE
ncbi:fimbrial assembly protein [Sporosarcina sp. ACRSL]|uniref:PilN domain-containing protein n=1 Tax=Sporosarcina sp. ACRSL TaxID=2918215 RepID=UPI001EF45DBC|nr:fimbrial assembly protein [Sporosarcina sp. ACRSL]MCG7345007.1 fimbrial assembly protein [Sporosarcina sp. ACRSL]